MPGPSYSGENILLFIEEHKGGGGWGLETLILFLINTLIKHCYLLFLLESIDRSVTLFSVCILQWPRRFLLQSPE